MRNSFWHGLIAVAMAGSMASGLHAATIYSNDFETNTNGFDTSSTTTLPTDGSPIDSPDTSSTWLGRFSGSDCATLTLNGLTAGTTYTVAFDLFIGRSWDGDNTSFGPDRWSLTTDASSSPLVDTSFNNHIPSDGLGGFNYTQSYSDTSFVGISSNSSFTGADVLRGAIEEPNFEDRFNRYGIYYFGHGAGNPVLTFVATGSTNTLTFCSFALQGVSDEFWAIDNVSVSSVPEPASMAVLGLGFAGAIGYRLRRRTAKVG